MSFQSKTKKFGVVHGGKYLYTVHKKIDDKWKKFGEYLTINETSKATGLPPYIIGKLHSGIYTSYQDNWKITKEIHQKNYHKNTGFKKLATFGGYPIFLSDRPKKKYFAVVDNKKVYFGGDPKIYEQYHDKIGYYKHLDHNDEERRKRYQQRHQKYHDRVGSASWLSWNLLWS